LNKILQFGVDMNVQ